jgi:hypothetical protein
MPFPVTDLNPTAAWILTWRTRAPATMAAARGCSLPDSAAATRASSSFSDQRPAGRMSVRVGLPAVMVPVGLRPRSNRGDHVILSSHQSHARLLARRHAWRGPGYARRVVPGIAASITLALAVAACSSSSGSGASPARTSAPASSGPAAISMLGAHSLPAQTSRTLPAFPAFYDAHKDAVIVTDAFPKPAAVLFHANYAPSLSAVMPASQPAWYIVRGRAAPGQLAVLGSEPGESDYSPLWRTVIVRWKAGTSPKVLTSDNMILELAKKGQLTATRTSLVVNATVVSKP